MSYRKVSSAAMNPYLTKNYCAEFRVMAQPSAFTVRVCAALALPLRMASSASRKIELGHPRALLAEIFQQIVDPPQVEQLTAGREHRRLGRCRRARVRRQRFLWVEEVGEGVRVILHVLAHVAVRNGGVALHAEERHPPRRKRLREAIHFRYVGVAQRTIGSEEEQHHRALPGPFRRGMRTPRRIGQRELRYPIGRAGACQHQP